MVAAFPVIDTDDKKLLCCKAMEPLLNLFLDADAKYHNHRGTRFERCKKNIERFIELIKTSPISFEILLARIKNQYQEIKKYYDDECADACLWYCCDRCSRYCVSMEMVLNDIANYHTESKEMDEYGYDSLYPDKDFSLYEPDSDKIKIALTDDRDKKDFCHAKKDIPRHQRNKGLLPTKKKSIQTKTVDRRASEMKKSRFLVKDFSVWKTFVYLFICLF